MNISRLKLIFAMGTYIGAMVCGLGGFATSASAQNAISAAATSTSVSRSDSVADSATHESASVTDDKLMQRVKTALHTDPYFYDEHVTVSVENGDVVLRGFVTSDWDIRDALRIAKKAAGGRRVIDDLSIKLGGSR
jgi:osmotically-inducible protein OsmY